MAGEEMFLWWGSGSAPCWKVMLALEEKGITNYGHKLVSFEKQEHKGEDILKINPRGQVPTFKHKDLVINESQAVCDYLEDAFKEQGTRLIPDDLQKRALVSQKKYESINLHKKGNEDLLMYLFKSKPEFLDEKLLESKKKSYKAELEVWEKQLEKMGDDSFIAGKDFSMADIAIFPTLAFHVRVGLRFDEFPHLGKYYKKMADRPSVKKSWPPHWKESEPKNFLGDL